MIQLYILAQKLTALNVNQSTALWIVDFLNVNPSTALWIFEFLTHRSQYVNLDRIYLEILETNTSTPQGSVLFLLLYSLYINDYKAIYENTCYIKFANDIYCKV